MDTPIYVCIGALCIYTGILVYRGRLTLLYSPYAQGYPYVQGYPYICIPLQVSILMYKGSIFIRRRIYIYIHICMQVCSLIFGVTHIQGYTNAHPYMRILLNFDMLIYKIIIIKTYPQMQGYPYISGYSYMCTQLWDIPIQKGIP